MGSLYGTHEIVEVKDEINLNDYSNRYNQSRTNEKQKEKEKKPQGYSRYIEDDINKLFEGINIRNSFNGSSYSDETSGATPRKNPSKKPMRMSLSSSSGTGIGIGYSEPVSLKQALRGLCISQASEMAAMKRHSMPPGSPALSDSGKFTDFYKSVVKGTDSGSGSRSPMNQESTSNIPRKIPNVKSYTNSPQASPHVEKSTESPKPPQKLNEILLTPDSGPETSSESINSGVKNNTKSTPKSRYKGKSTRTSPRVVKTVIRTKNIVKKKSKQELTSPAETKLICQKCHCTMQEPKKEQPLKDSKSKSKSPLSTITLLSNNKTSKYGDKGEFTQSSNSSICEYSSSTSISEDRNLSGCIIINRPHMSKDIRWQAINHMMKQTGFLGLGHFNLLKKLGCGDIGTVYLAELIGTNYPFAIKIMDNEFLERRQKMPRAHMEREILSILDHPFLPTLYAHFVSENLSCLVMEYCPGGDLHVLRQKQPARFFHEQAARFYVAEVLLALEYLHMLGIVYRDLKPENILVREDGHIMVTDFDLSLRCSVNPVLLQSPSTGPTEPPRMSGPCAGSNCIDPFCMKPTCQVQVSCFRPPKGRKTKPDLAALHRKLPQLVAEPTEARSNSFVGTHEYLAPEIIKGDGHGSAVDWWTFGIFLYELLYGRTPFKGSGNDQTLANVVLESLRFPETPLVSFHARDLIKGLLAKEPENRLGFNRGAAEIKQHPFFDGLNWALIRCASPPELPEPYDVAVSKAVALEKAKKYLDYNGASGGGLEFELF